MSDIQLKSVKIILGEMLSQGVTEVDCVKVLAVLKKMCIEDAQKFYDSLLSS